MQIHNALTPAQRARASHALDWIVTNLPECRSVPEPPEGQLVFTLERSGGGVETLRVRLRDDEMRLYVVLRVGAKALRTSFVEHLRKGHPANPTTMAQAVQRLSEWRRYVEDVPSDEALRDIEEKRSIAVEAAVGAATMLDSRWKTLRISPASDLKPPLIFLGDPSGRTSIFRTIDAQDGSSGTMSDELAGALSIMPEHLFVTASKPISNPGIEIEFGPFPSIRVLNDLSPMDMMHTIRHAASLGFTLSP